MSRDLPVLRAPLSGLVYAPLNEAGVVFFFGCWHTGSVFAWSACNRLSPICEAGRSIREDPHYFAALRDLGWHLRYANLKEAEHYLSRAMQEAQDDVLVHIYYARLKFESDPAVAEEHYKKAIQLDPGDGELHRLLGLFYQQHRRDRDANRELFLAVESDPRDQSSINACVSFLRNLGNRDAAWNLYLSVTSGSLLPVSIDWRYKREGVWFGRQLGMS